MAEPVDIHGLTHAQHLFADAYASEGFRNVTRAWAKAFPGVPELIGDDNANAMLKLPQVQTYLTLVRKEMAASYGITEENVLDELSVIAFSDIGDMFTHEGEKRELHKMPARVRRAISNFDVVERNNGETMSVGWKVKMYDKVAALDKAAKHLGLFERDNEQRNAQEAVDSFFERAAQLTSGATLEHQSLIIDDEEDEEPIATRSLPAPVGQTPH